MDQLKQDLAELGEGQSWGALGACRVVGVSPRPCEGCRGSSSLWRGSAVGAGPGLRGAAAPGPPEGGHEGSAAGSLRLERAWKNSVFFVY